MIHGFGTDGTVVLALVLALVSCALLSLSVPSPSVISVLLR